MSDSIAEVELPSLAILNGNIFDPQMGSVDLKNNNFKPLLLEKEQDVVIWGIVRNVIHKV